MNLRAKTLLIAVITSTLVFAAVSIALDRVVTRAFLRLEEEEIKEKVQQVHSVFLNEITDLTSLTQDWAKWDDTYTFIQNKNQSYIKSNLIDDSFVNNRLSLAFYVDASGQIVYSKTYSLSQKKEIPVPESFLRHLTPNSPLLKLDEGIGGILILPETPLFIASQPILQSEGTGPARGVLIFGRFLDDFEVTHLTGITHLSFKISTIESPASEPDVKAVVEALGKKPGVFVKPLNSFSTAGYRLYSDIYDEPALTLKVTMPRTIYAQGTSTISFFRMTLLIIGLLSVVLVLASSEQMVISRILRLSDSVGLIGTKREAETTVSIPGSDEVSRLASSIDNMLRRLEIVGGELRLRAELLDSANDFIFLRDLTGKLLYVNEMGSKLYGYSRDELMRMSISDLVASHLLYNYDNRVKEILERGEARFETQHRRKDGTLIDVDVNSRVIKTEDGTFLLSTIRDITERKEAERKLQELYENERKLRQQLEEEIRNRAEYTRALVHELKTPLTPVMASSDLLLEELKEEPYRSLALNVSRGADNLNRRINELLDLARGEIGALKINPMPMDPNRLLEEISESSRPIAGSAGQTFELDIPARLPEIIADEDRLRQVLLNLVGNALKYTPNGGKITVKAEVREQDLVFEIKDTGPGIADDEKELLFQPYHRLERDRERVGGIGLGLFLSKTLVELHGGRVWVESKLGEGSTFAFSIPLGSPKEWINSWQER